MFPTVLTDRRLFRRRSLGSVGTEDGGNMRLRLYQNCYVRDKRMYKALMFGIKILEQGRELGEAVRIAAGYYKVDPNKLQSHLVKWTGIPPEKKRKSWPDCSACMQEGTLVPASWEVHLDRYYQDLGRTFEQENGPNLDQDTPYLCQSCYALRKSLNAQPSILSAEWVEVLVPIDRRCFLSYRQAKLAG